MMTDVTPTVTVVVPTAQEAEAIAPENFTDKETVMRVQKALLAKGYVDIGEANGELGQKTKDVILSFRARNDLPLLPVIDSQFIAILENAPQKQVPVEQATATKAEVAQKVEVVAVTQKIINQSWWAKAWAFVAGVPPIFIGLISVIIDNLDEAYNAISPLRLLVGDSFSIWIWLGVTIVVAGIMGYQAMMISKLSKQIEEKAVEGYRQGTIKNDVPKEEA